MGMDDVELVIEVEDAFHIIIPDAKVEKVRTVGDLFDVVYALVRHDKYIPCPTQQCFYLLRRNLMAITNVPRSAVKLDTPLADLFALPHRREQLNALLDALKTHSRRRPGLARPRWMEWLVYGVVPLLAFFSVGYGLAWSVGFFAALIVGFAGHFATKPWQKHFSRDCSRVRDLVNLITIGSDKHWTREDVLRKIKQLIVEQLGLKDDSKITMDTNFVQDLGF